MQRDKLVYWSTTGLLGSSMLYNAFLYLTSNEMAEAFKHLGFPDFLRVELAIAKIIGTIVLLLPVFSSKMKEWAYAGFGIAFISAALAHYTVNDPATKILIPIFFLVLLIVSNIFFAKTTIHTK